EGYFDLPKYIVADAGYGSEQNYHDILSNRGREALITYNMYQKEQKRKYKKDEYTCPNQQQLIYKYDSVRTDRYGFQRQFKVYESEDCSTCLLRSSCTKAKPGNNRKMMVNEVWEEHKEYVR